MKIQFDDKGIKITFPKNLSHEEAAVDAAGFLFLCDGSKLGMTFLGVLAEQFGEEFVTDVLQEYMNFAKELRTESPEGNLPEWLIPMGQS